MLKFFFFWKMTNNFNHSVIQWDFSTCFQRTKSKILGTVLERDTIMSSFGINRDRCFVLWLTLRSTGVGAGKFLGVRRIFVQKKLHKKKTPPKKKLFMLYGRRWAPFLLLYSRFCSDFHGFCESSQRVFPRFRRICPNFQQIQTFGDALASPAPRLLHQFLGEPCLTQITFEKV